MTNEEAIKILQFLLPTPTRGDARSTENMKISIALLMAIKALEQEPIIDKIRAEIEYIIDNTYDSTDYDKSLYNGAYKDGLYEALDIIDKYKTESEDTE